MGANAQTSVPAFTAGQILTAAEMTEVNTGIPVFATTTTRDAAFGGAGEKVLAQGQMAFIEATNTTQYYNGSTWVTLATNPGLVCVKAETAFTGVSTVTADNVFTSSYTNYVLNVSWTGSAVGSVELQLRVGGVAATSNYNYQRLRAYATTIDALRTGASASIRVGANGTINLWNSFSTTIYNPQLAQPTLFNSQLVPEDGSYPSPAIQIIAGNNSNATAYDGFSLAPASGTITGTYSVYGYSKTV